MQVTVTDTSAPPAGPLWWGLASGVVAICALSAAVSRTGLHEVVYTPAVILLAAGFAVVVRYRHLQPSAGWATFAFGLLLLALGDAAFALPWGPDLGSSGLSLADPLYLVGSLVLVLGALRLKSAHVGERDRESLIDATSIGLAAAVLLWHPLVEPRLQLGNAAILARVVNASYPILDVVVLAMMLWLLLGTRHWTPSTVLLVAGACVYLFADFAYTVRVEQGTLADPSLNWLDTLWILAYGLYLLGAMHPSARELGRLTAPDDRPISRGRLLLSGVTLLVPMVALGLSDAGPADLAFAVTVEVLLVVLVLLRLSALAAGERRARRALVDRERYFRSLVQNSSEAMMVVDAGGLVLDASPAVQALLGVSPEELVGRHPGEVIAGLDRHATVALWTAAVASSDVVVAQLSITHDAETRWLEARATNLMDDPAVAGLVINIHDVTDRRQLQLDLERRAFTDSLTGLPNRALFDDRLGQLVSRRDPPDLAVVYCDLDRFKDVNDRFGHSEGDRLLQITASRLAATVRPEDTVARLGGDEFAVLVSGPDVLPAARSVAGRIVDELRHPLPVGDEQVPVSVSVGVAWVSGGTGDSGRVLMHSADEAMYRAKRAGGDRFVVLGDEPVSRSPVGEVRSEALDRV